MTTRARRLLVVTLALALALGAVLVTDRASRRPPELVVVDPACPPLLKDVPSSSDDYGDVVHWAGGAYWRSEGRARAGALVGVVSCSVSADYGARGWRVAPGDWPDGTSTALPRGTELHEQRADRSGRALVARTSEGDRLYCRDDGSGGPPTC